MPHAVGTVLPEVAGQIDLVSDRIVQSTAAAKGANVIVTATRRSNTQKPRIERWLGTPVGDTLQFDQGIPLSTGSSILADLPAISPSHRNTLFAAWRELPDEGSVWKIKLAESLDDGVTFSPPRNVLSGRLEVEHNVGYRKPEAPHLQATPDVDIIFVSLESHGAIEHILNISSPDGFRSEIAFGVANRDRGAGPPAHFDMVSSVAFPDGSVGVTWVQINRRFQDDPKQTKSWEVFYRRVTSDRHSSPRSSSTPSGPSFISPT